VSNMHTSLRYRLLIQLKKFPVFLLEKNPLFLVMMNQQVMRRILKSTRMPKRTWMELLHLAHPGYPEMTSIAPFLCSSFTDKPSCIDKHAYIHAHSTR